MAGRVYAIGDVHGCSAALDALLAAIPLDGDDLVVTLGDYVDRGPDSRGVIERLIRLEATGRLRPLLGNHELMLLAAREDAVERASWLECGGRATEASYGGHVRKAPPEHWEFLSRCRPWFETERHFFVHANYDADLDLADQPEYLLYWEHVTYGPPAPHVNGKTAVVGHTPQSSGEPLDGGHFVCIDTFCCGGGWLTALEVRSGLYWQANERGEVRGPLPL